MEFFRTRERRRRRKKKLPKAFFIKFGTSRSEAKKKGNSNLKSRAVFCPFVLEAFSSLKVEKKCSIFLRGKKENVAIDL